MPTLASTVTLVIADDRSDGRAVRALARAVTTTRAATSLVLVTADPRALSGALARRTRVVRVRRPAEVTTAAAAELGGRGVVLVATPRTRLADGWEDGAAAAAAALSGGVGRCGEVLLSGDGPLDPAAPQHPLAAVAGVETATAPDAAFSIPALAAAAPAPRPVGRISAVLIVKDEERVLAACLEALRGAVDEVVVYDTGSSDRTTDIAREHGALVVQGHWDDHFGNARNRALAHATGEWVLSVDADEVLTGDATAVRRACAAAAQGLARIPIVSTSWSGAADGQHSHPVRLFRRGAFEWKGALHEYLELLPGTPAVTDAPSAEGAWLAHSGYQYLTFSDRDKPQRNLEIAEAAVAALPTSGEDPTMAWDAYGRSLFVVGRHDDAMAALDHVLDLQSNPSAVVQSGRAAMSAMRQRREYSRADRWLAALAAHGEAPAAVEGWRAHVAFAAGDLDAVERHLAAAERAPLHDRWNVPFKTVALDDLRAEAALRAGRGEQALELLLASLQRDPDHGALAALVAAADACGADLAEVAARVPDTFVGRSAQEAVVLQQHQGHAWLLGLHRRDPQDRDVVVAGTVVGARGGLEEAVTWSSAARPLGLAAFCPLRAIGADARRSAADRVLAWSLVAGVAEDEDARVELASLLASLPPQQLLEVVAPAAELVPAVTDVLLRAVEASSASLATA